MPIPKDIEISFEPSEKDPTDANKSIAYYMRVIPQIKDADSVGMLFLFIKIKNANSTESATLQAIDISFPGSQQPSLSLQKGLPLVLKGGRSKTFESTTIKLVGAPPKIKFSLTFKDFANPVIGEFKLAVHPVKYRFPFKLADGTKHGQYLQLAGGHIDQKGGGEGGQVFAQDVHALSWRNSKLDHKGASNGTNEDHLIFGRPLYAMGNGIVVHAIDTYDDNPLGDKNIRRRPGHWDGDGKVKDIGVACLKKGQKYRIVVASVSETNQLTLTSLEQTSDASLVTKLSERQGPTASKVVIANLNGDYFVTTTLARTTATTTLWQLDNNGAINEINHITTNDCATARLLRLTDDKLVLAVHTPGGKLHLNVLFRLHNDLFKGLAAATSNSVGTIENVGTDFDLLAIEPDPLAIDDADPFLWRFVTAVQTATKRLKIVAWRVDDLGGGDSDGGPGGVQLSKTDEYDGDVVSEIAGAPLVEDMPHFGFAIRQADNTMKLLVFKLEKESIVYKMEKTGGPSPAAMLRAGRFKRESILVMSLTSANMLHLTMLDIEINNYTINNQNDVVETGPTDLYCAASMETAQTTMVTVVRTSNKGNARLILWQLSGGNSLKILYGKEIVTFAHLKKGSLDKNLFKTANGELKPLPITVTPGQLLAEAGNSGSAGGPHLHIQADRVEDEYLGTANTTKLIEYIKENEGSIGDITTPRPMHFTNVSAMVQTKVAQTGPNPFGDADGFGAYFDTYCMLPKS